MQKIIKKIKFKFVFNILKWKKSTDFSKFLFNFIFQNNTWKRVNLNFRIKLNDDRAANE